METRTFGKTGWEVGAIGLGCWNIGGQWGDVDEATAIATIHTAVDAGMNLIDTADAYGIPPGLSEELVGKAIKGRRNEVLIATKVGNYARRDGHALTYDSPTHVTLCCDASLGRMGIDVIDLYQCHLANLDDPTIFLEAFAELKAKGKIREYGISTNDVEVLKRFNREGTCAACQLDYSILNRSPEEGVLPYCQENGIGTLIRGPLAKGLLSGKYAADSTFTDTVRESWNVGDQHAKFLEQVQVVDQLRFLETPERTMAQASLQFVLAHPAVSCAIPGAKSPEQARQNAAAADGCLSDEDLARVGQVA